MVKGGNKVKKKKKKVSSHVKVDNVSSIWLKSFWSENQFKGLHEANPIQMCVYMPWAFDQL